MPKKPFREAHERTLETTFYDPDKHKSSFVTTRVFPIAGISLPAPKTAYPITLTPLQL
ncbi:hypothetical protein PAT3040_03883 [Paenibacillus agaridevorans]|jgi:hypothetical protein|uniref:Uncharacterized protein n=1 Tax=Paenibacillus agaridevorans TaxID=171404 RepID=A0A2R5ERD4_9BACL|nr:hypothetical protein PAT3040_03883 [Paenibacillus agaridevorans]